MVFAFPSPERETIGCLWRRPRRGAGFIHIGRPATRNHDPICLDFRRPAKTGEAGIVRLDHEEILRNDSIRIVETIAPSFLALLAQGMRFIKQ